MFSSFFKSSSSSSGGFDVGEEVRIPNREEKHIFR